MTSSSRNIELDVDLDIFRQGWHEELINKQTAEAIEANLQSSSSRQTSKVDGRSSSNQPSATSHQASQGVFNFNQPSQSYSSTRSTRESLPTFRNQPEPKKFIIGIDYGTSNTSISFFSHPLHEGNPTIRRVWDIQSIANWPDSGILGWCKQVPSESWYSLTPIKRGARKLEVEQEGNIYDESDNDEMREYEVDAAESEDTFYGYSVPYQQYTRNCDRIQLTLVKNAKSMLLDTSHTEQDRNALGPIFQKLLERKLIRKYGKRGQSDPRDVQDVITDQLVYFFSHTKKELILNHGFSDLCEVQFVFNVPVIWSPFSSRILQSCIEEAIKQTEFGTLENESINNLLIVAEPDSATAFVLATNGDIVAAGETIVVMDCGGGTVDLVTYTATSAYPVTMKKQEVQPGGDNCGASYINLNFEKHLTRRLADEDYLFQNGETLRTIVNRQVAIFEKDLKRRVDITVRACHKIYIAGLRGDEERRLYGTNAKRFEQNHIIMNRSDWVEIFKPIIERSRVALANQLALAFGLGKKVRKVFLVGGFGESPSLQNYLRNYLKAISAELDDEIKLIVSKGEGNSALSSSAGSVVLFFDLQNAPTRKSQSSYGFLRREPYEPAIFPEHKRQKPRLDSDDGESYLSTISYFMVKGDDVPFRYKYPPLPTYHTFPSWKTKLLCEEILYVSDTATQSHYSRENARNGSKVQLAGKIVVDMTDLKDKEIKLTRRRKGAKRFYKVEYELVAIVEGRNLRYEARYPIGANARKRGPTGQVSIAAAFKPGEH